jgi:thiamine pyrophosphokinase
MKHVVILSGGTIKNPECIREKCGRIDEPVVICADGGTGHLRPLGLTPSVIIGDMDSIDEGDRDYFDFRGTTIVAYPAAKDETDTELALMYAFDLHPQEIWIVGALGGRIDHALANVSLLVAAARRGVPTRIVDGDCEIFVVTGKVTVEGERGQTVSLLPLSSVVTGLTLDGFEYPLQDGILEVGRPMGISNTLAAAQGTISVHAGYLLVVRYYRKEA